MFKETPVNTPHVYAFTASGKLTDEDYKSFIPRIEERLEEEKPISLFIRLEDFKGWEAKAAWQDFKFGMEHEQDLLRIALVGDSAWEKWMVMIGKSFLGTETRYFDSSESEEAWTWLSHATNQLQRDEYPGYRNILVAADYSDHTERAVRRGLEIAKQHAAKLTLFHAVDYILMPGEFYDVAADIELEKKQLQVARERMQELAEQADYAKLHTVVETGNPSGMIVEYADEHDIDLIIAGSHGRRGIERMLGSVVNRILHSANCDVLTVRL